MIRCMIIERDQNRKDILKHYIQRLPELELVCWCRSDLEAIRFLNLQAVDLLFLDLENLTIHDTRLIRSGSYKAPAIIIAKNKNVLLNERGIVDRLATPLSFKQFCQAVQRYSHQTRPFSWFESSLSPLTGSLVFQSGKTSYRIAYADLLFFKAQGDYVLIHTCTKKIMVRGRLKHFEEKLPPEHFLRIHRSVIISLMKVTHATPFVIRLGSYQLPVSTRSKKLVFQRISKMLK